MATSPSRSIFRGADVFGRVSAHDEQVGIAAGLNGAEIGIFAEKPGGIQRRGLHGEDWRDAGFPQELDFALRRGSVKYQHIARIRSVTSSAPAFQARTRLSRGTAISMGYAPIPRPMVWESG